MNTSQKILLGFLGGLATGVITGLLLAPEKGEDTRQMIAHKAKDLSKDLVEKQLQPSIDKAKGAIEGISNYANKVISRNQNGEKVEA